ncbi:hypothetical protein Ptr902_10236 [Pyrenophora tritici-repentis]|uniref:Uncharacterized protein n=1 Tax=Pyrenophora tritici-repentis TaxID=45151 RepID=A0A5M9L2N5_9PLEO|nr:hypothetical protein PtrV1_11350 [Pyrenophora tritici-repentis]KAF7443450.1 hypothetical protein A1F99_115240 [Pyrenophora tritici-repentis]KAF7566841.1 hypothetical protein PtrM4_151610 [Pyrenophora tritici-repentis]KAI0570641.1 hypothetical protein Alg215_10923 [Pyrenophora tritici-repentis]KAI0572807.1 hypothetical protein Alg130_10352 [Pyrenophora tritici-repentis]
MRPLAFLLILLIAMGACQEEEKHGECRSTTVIGTCEYNRLCTYATPKCWVGTKVVGPVIQAAPVYYGPDVPYGDCKGDNECSTWACYS